MEQNTVNNRNYLNSSRWTHGSLAISFVCFVFLPPRNIYYKNKILDSFSRAKCNLSLHFKGFMSTAQDQQTQILQSKNCARLWEGLTRIC